MPGRRLGLKILAMIQGGKARHCITPLSIISNSCFSLSKFSTRLDLMGYRLWSLELASDFFWMDFSLMILAGKSWIQPLSTRTKSQKEKNAVRGVKRLTSVGLDYEVKTEARWHQNRPKMKVLIAFRLMKELWSYGGRNATYATS